MFRNEPTLAVYWNEFLNEIFEIFLGTYFLLICLCNRCGQVS